MIAEVAVLVAAEPLTLTHRSSGALCMAGVGGIGSDPDMGDTP